MAVNDKIGVGREDVDAHGVDIVMTHGGAAVLPRSLRKAHPAALDLVGDLQRAAVAVLDAQASVVDLLREGRALGLSWDALGWCIGLTGPGAQKMVDRADHEARLLEDL